MTPFSEILIAQLTKILTASLLKAGGLRFRRLFAEPERAQALERCCEAGIVAMIQTAATDDEGREHLGDVIRDFFSSPEIADDLGRAVAPLLKGQHPDVAEMRELLEEVGFDPATLPGFDVTSAFTAFEGGFAAAALEQPVLRAEIKTHVLFA